ncbi:CamS family sex pheromone protein [Bacillus timonensis]|nr:CamS family sex pheromone protein [Bacillus timonensis]
MKKLLIVGLSFAVLLSGCAPSFDKDEEEIVQETNDSNEKAIIPKYNISESYYRTILPFKPGEARGLVAANLNTRLDIDEFEMGLMRIAQDSFSADKYYYQEGQYISKKTIQGWLSRKLTEKQLAAAKKEESENVGLNPPFDSSEVLEGLVDQTYEEGNYENEMSKSPIYLAHILEHNYLVKNKDDKVQLGGVVLGIALNSVHYYNLPDTLMGYPRETKIPQEEIEKEGKRIAEEVLNRVRRIKGLEKVPITIALFKQEDISSIAPGSFFAKTYVDEESKNIDDWEVVDEEYYFFPSSKASEDYREDSLMFSNFITDIDEFFPNYTGVIGRGFYVNEELRELTIDIPMQFYGKAEVIGFTQYVTGLVMDQFPNYINLQVYISSDKGPESLIIRETGQEKPFVHIYN